MGDSLMDLRGRATKRNLDWSSLAVAHGGPPLHGPKRSNEGSEPQISLRRSNQSAAQVGTSPVARPAIHNTAKPGHTQAFLASR
eukprot:4920715-Alexandrium_andersonii.AAC.1